MTTACFGAFAGPVAGVEETEVVIAAAAEVREGGELDFDNSSTTATPIAAANPSVARPASARRRRTVDESGRRGAPSTLITGGATVAPATAALVAAEAPGTPALASAPAIARYF